MLFTVGDGSAFLDIDVVALNEPFIEDAVPDADSEGFELDGDKDTPLDKVNETIEVLDSVGGTDLEFVTVSEFDAVEDVVKVTTALRETVNAEDLEMVTTELGEIVAA